MAPISGLHEPERLAGAVAAAGFAKRPAAKASRATRAIAEPELPVAMRAIPMKLAPLVSQYKGQGRLSLRVEHMPVLSRLSAGRNNGDNTWSLGLDELEDLAFLLPEGLDERHVLAIRVVSFDGVEASTLAVLDFPLSLDGDVSAAIDVADDAQLRRLRDELIKTKAILAARDSELAAARKNIELAKAEWQAEQTARPTASDTQKQIIEAREHWLQEQEAALSKAKAEWNEGEAARLAAAETQWHRQLADATARCERAETALAQSKAAPVHDDELELRLREELAEAQNNLAEREAALEQMKLAAAQTQERLRQEFKTALSRAQSDWKAGEAARFSAAEALTRADSKTGEAARLATAEANWRKQSEAALAELVERCERTEAALAHARAAPDPRESELRDLRQELTVAKTVLADREIALAQSRIAAEETQARLQQEQQSALAKAKADWAANEAARSTAAEARWRNQSESVLAEVTARCEKAEAALEQSQLTVEQMRERGQRELEAALSQAKANWKASEAPRAATADMQLRQQLADATERYEAAEMALAQLRAKMDAARVHTDETAIGHLRDEIAALHATLAGREAELAEMRSAGASRVVPESRIVVHQDRGWVAPETEPAPKGSRRLIRDAVAAAILAASGIIFFPNIEALVSDNWPATAQSPAPAQAAVPATPHVAAQPMAVIARNGNVRSGPSKGAAILATLQQGVKVAILEQQGNWTHIRVDTKDGKSQQGWVFSSFLKSDDLRSAKN